jgi:phosphopantetheinyl transferase
MFTTQTDTGMFNNKEMLLLPYLVGYGSTPLTKHKQVAKKQLIHSLLSRSLPEYRDHQSTTITLTTDRAGCPLLHGNNVESFHVSFSYCKEKIWAVITKGSPVGIDVETPDSFTDTYPYMRVFNSFEHSIISQFYSKRPVGAAALWACKEAAVKARGTGFSDLEPIDVTVRSISPVYQGYEVEMYADQSYCTMLRQENDLWCAVAMPSSFTTET